MAGAGDAGPGSGQTSATEGRHRAGLPRFDLEYAFDSPHDPRQVTVFTAEADSLTTAWISADVDTAVPLEQVA